MQRLREAHCKCRQVRRLDAFAPCQIRNRLPYAIFIECASVSRPVIATGMSKLQVWWTVKSPDFAPKSGDPSTSPGQRFGLRNAHAAVPLPPGPAAMEPRRITRPHIYKYVASANLRLKFGTFASSIYPSRRAISLAFSRSVCEINARRAPIPAALPT